MTKIAGALLGSGGLLGRSEAFLRSLSVLVSFLELTLQTCDLDPDYPETTSRYLKVANSSVSDYPMSSCSRLAVQF